MLTRGAGILVVCLAASGLARADDSPARDIKDLEGDWQVVEIERDGKKSNDEEVTNLHMVFKGQEIAIQRGDGAGRARRKVFKLGPNLSPRPIDITSLDGQENGKTAACIHSLEEGRLKLCMPYAPDKDPTERPTEFKTRKGDGLMLFVLKRVKPKS